MPLHVTSLFVPFLFQTQYSLLHPACGHHCHLLMMLFGTVLRSFFQPVFVCVLLPSVLMPGKLGVKKEKLKQLLYHTFNSFLEPHFPFSIYCI